MSRIEGFKHIVADPDTCHGAARFGGTSTAIWMIAQDFANGSNRTSIQSVYTLTDEMFNEAIQFIRPNRIEGFTRVAN
jgi:uncharacterized protein (DUF433 family)